MSDVARLLEIMARLRDPHGGCPWDLEQDFTSIAPYTIEEAYEVDDAIRRGDLAGLRDELGDLLLQVVFHAQMAREAGHFDFGAVVDAVCDKLVARHPHVFGEAQERRSRGRSEPEASDGRSVLTARSQTDAWERHKAAERARKGASSAADDVPLGLPALLRARKLLSRAARAGFPAPELADPQGALARSRAALEGPAPEGANGEAHGALLLAAAAGAQQAGVDPEQALRDAVARFEQRLREWEKEMESA